MINFGNSRYSPQPENKPAPAAEKNGFDRYIGYDNPDDFTKFLIRLYSDTKKDGAFIEKTIPNPSNPEVSAISSVISISEDFSEQFVRNSIHAVSGSMIDFSKIGSAHSESDIANIFCEVLSDIKNSGAAQNAVKNAFIKFICWCIRYSTFKITNILYTGDISKYEVCWLYIMHRLGCCVNYVCMTGDSSYLAADPQSQYSVLHAGKITLPLDIDFSQAIAVSLDVDTQTPVLKENFNEEIIKKYDKRILASGNCFDSGRITVYFTAFIGFDDEAAHKNFLYNLREDIISKSSKTLIFAENFKKPSYDEGAAFLSVNRSDMKSMIKALAQKIDIPNCPARTQLARKNFISIMNKQAASESNIQRMFNLGVNMIIWLKSCTEHTDFHSDIPVMMYYGKITPHELIFLKFLCSTGFDVIYLSTDKSVLDMFRQENDGIIQIFELPLSCGIYPYPEKPVRAKFATTAYTAERELDSLLYNDGNLFRNHQFATCRSVTLKTTYEEIGILWNQEAKYRTGFNSENNLVTVPNIFAKISGLRDDNEEEYWKDVSSKITSSSLIFKSLPFFVPDGADSYDGFFNNTIIDIPKLINSPLNKYNYLNDNVQQFIFSKMQETIDCGFINLPYPDIMHLVIKSGLGFNPETLRIIQNYDFTKEIPKVIIIDNTPQTFNVYECIYLVLLNLMGFDIIIYTPTGYKNLETYVSPQAYEEYTMPRFRDNLNIPLLRPAKKFGGFFRWK